MFSMERRYVLQEAHAKIQRELHLTTSKMQEMFPDLCAAVEQEKFENELRWSNLHRRKAGIKPVHAIGNVSLNSERKCHR